MVTPPHVNPFYIKVAVVRRPLRSTIFCANFRKIPANYAANAARIVGEYPRHARRLRENGKASKRRHRKPVHQRKKLLGTMEEFVTAETASLSASLIDRAAARARVEAVLALTPVAATPADAPLFCEKGRASVSALSPVAAAAPCARLWLRLTAAERRRINVAAAFFGQSTAAFLRDAVAAFMDDLLPLAAARPGGVRPLARRSHERRVKLAFRVDVGMHAAVHSAAAQRGQSVQTLLTTAIDVHLARLMDRPAAMNLRPVLEAFDAVTTERAAGLGAEVIDFPLRRRIAAPAPVPRRHAAR
jgi:hypothetical protein